jgi:hypothetical protein
VLRKKCSGCAVVVGPEQSDRLDLAAATGASRKQIRVTPPFAPRPSFYPETPFPIGAATLLFGVPRALSRCQVMTALPLIGVHVAVRIRQSHWLAFKGRKIAVSYRKRP